MSQSFGDSGSMPWGQWFEYTVSNVQVSDHTYFVTVIYSTLDVSSSQDQYLRHWFHSHPALVDLQSKTNFREVSIQDPVYSSYLQQAVPNTPAILITRPADNGYFGRTVYLAYGQYLSTDPNEIAEQIQTALTQESQAMYEQDCQQCRPTPYTPQPQYTPQQYQPQTVQRLPPVIPQRTNVLNGGTDLLVLGGIAVLLFVFLRRKR